MDQEQRSFRSAQSGTPTPLTSSPRSGAARQAARSKGLAWVAALTLGAGAASAVGAAAVVANLSSATSATSASAAAATSATSTGSGSQLQAAQAPTTTTIPPVATSGAS